jgi:hypothetical protein
MANPFRKRYYESIKLESANRRISSGKSGSLEHTEASANGINHMAKIKSKISISHCSKNIATKPGKQSAVDQTGWDLKLRSWIVPSRY